MTSSTISSDAAELLYEVRGTTGWITLNRPRARNALTFEMYDRLAEICAGITEHDPVKALVICGAGDKAFAAGTDISLFRDFNEPAQAHQYEARMEEVLSAVETAKIPTIAALHGAATGGGGAIAAACDIRLAARDLKFGFPIARTLGNCLSAGNLARLSSLIGMGRTRDLMLIARLMGAQEAREAGFVSEILEDKEAVLARAGDLADTLSGHAPLTMRASKEALRRLRNAQVALIDDADLIESCYMSADFKEGMDAFLSKRKPDWQGK